ncbi:protein preY, mitochondrial [Zalophus californianus]|uniref:Protein preY, mitochondrial n=1 Tax=Zalophus californianus TaxID=9704 RepID=A0A6P9F7X7_ZALCA|nr:protein preY, mitochondrial [Zalophus californianus]
MLSGACGWLASALRGPRVPPFTVARRCLHASGSQRSADKSERPGDPPRAFDPALLEFLVCPLSKKTLRCDSPSPTLRSPPPVAGGGGGGGPRGRSQPLGSPSGQSGYFPLPFLAPAPAHYDAPPTAAGRAGGDRRGAEPPGLPNQAAHPQGWVGAFTGSPLLRNCIAGDFFSFLNADSRAPPQADPVSRSGGGTRARVFLKRTLSGANVPPGL